MTTNDSMPAQRRILFLGANGMLGHTLLRFFSASPGFETHGSVRSANTAARLAQPGATLHSGVDVENADALWSLVAAVRPQLVVNCVGIVKQLAESEDALAAIPINAILPHRLARVCGFVGARLVHISTDCVFSGRKGGYTEQDVPDATDLYGRSKLLGEVSADHVVTLRTSIIGHELDGARGLLEWFLSQEGRVQGYRKAVFSGLTTLEIARFIRDYLMPHPEVRGVHHLSAAPISKYDLLGLVAREYGKQIEVQPHDGVQIDRSLDSTRLRGLTGYEPPTWPSLVGRLREFHLAHREHS